MQIFVFFIFVLFDEYKVMKIFRLMQAFLWFKTKYKQRLIGIKYICASMDNIEKTTADLKNWSKYKIFSFFPDLDFQK